MIRVRRTVSTILACSMSISLGAQQQGPPPVSKTDRQRGQLMLKQLKEDIEKN